MRGARGIFLHAVTANTRGKQVKYDIFKKISGTSIDKTVPRSTSVHNANFRGISRFLGWRKKILGLAKSVPRSKNNETITKILKNLGFGFATVMKPCRLIT